jgi:hypothetical protein
MKCLRHKGWDSREAIAARQHPKAEQFSVSVVIPATCTTEIFATESLGISNRNLSHNFQPHFSHLNCSSGLLFVAVFPHRGHFIVHM